jgi:hypothetical protein
LTIKLFGFLVIIYNFEQENTFDRLLPFKLTNMKRNTLVDFLIKHGFLPNKKAVLAPVPVRAKSPIPSRKGN